MPTLPPTGITSFQNKPYIIYMQCVISGFRRAVKRDLSFCNILHAVDYQLCTDFLGQFIGPIFKGKVVKEEIILVLPTGCPETLVSNYQPVTRNIPAERRPNVSTLSIPFKSYV
jgi:hypothetical protein